MFPFIFKKAAKGSTSVGAGGGGGSGATPATTLSQSQYGYDELIEKLTVIRDSYDQRAHPTAYKVLNETIEILQQDFHEEEEAVEEEDPDRLPKLFFYGSMARCNWDNLTEAQQSVWRRHAERALVHKTMAEDVAPDLPPLQDEDWWKI